jgi:hypothetical protein
MKCTLPYATKSNGMSHMNYVLTYATKRMGQRSTLFNYADCKYNKEMMELKHQEANGNYFVYQKSDLAIMNIF